MPCIESTRRPLLLRGTLTTFRRRCGKPSCRCATGEPHGSPALTYTEAGRTRTITLSPGEVDDVAAALARYETARAELEAQADGGERRSGGRGPVHRSRACLEDMIGWLEGAQAAALTHAELEEQLDTRGRELLRRMYQAELDLRAQREQRVRVTDAGGARRGAVEPGHVRPLATIFGTVTVARSA